MSRAIVILLALGACTDEHEVVVDLGVVDGFYEPMIDVPSTARAGEDVRLDVITYGGGCTALESTRVELTAWGAEIFPYDRNVIPNEGEKCPQNLIFIHHEAVVSFDTPGIRQVTVHGRRGRDEILVNFEISIQ